MSRLDQIKDEYAFTRQYPTWDNFIANQPIFKQQEYYNETSKLYAAECCQASLEKEKNQNEKHRVSIDNELKLIRNNIEEKISKYIDLRNNSEVISDLEMIDDQLFKILNRTIITQESNIVLL